MPSPFPGMDPYLEERSLWPDVHQRLIAYISETLQPQIRPKYSIRKDWVLRWPNAGDRPLRLSKKPISSFG